jgi:trehalose 6-phosphate synthase/phosphatase
MNDKINFGRLIIAAYRLPFKFVKQNKNYKPVQNSGGLVSAVLALSENFRKSKTTGDQKILWAGIADNLPQTHSSIMLHNEEFEIIPVNISEDLNQKFYGGFCNDLIWPLFHYFPSFSVFKNEYFEAYKEANELFFHELVKIIKPGDFIWVHDYQLMLLPGMIRNKFPNASIGFFLHIPFPSFELFRLLPKPWREAVIDGLLGADLVGFHTPDYAQYFVRSVKRVKGYDCSENIIFTPERIVKADAFPIGIDYDKFHEAGKKAAVIKEIQKIKKTLTGQKLIFSVDRLDYSKGLLLKLKGYETFLEKYPEWKEKVVFNMVVVPSRDTIEKYKEMKKEIESTVGRINGKYNSLTWTPVIYQYKSLNFDEMVGLYSVSSAGLITPLRDGMNLVAKEYIACQSEEKGVLILSEMTGAAAEMNEALIINPFDNLETAEAINTALQMKATDRKTRVDRMQKRISDYNVFAWAYDFFNQSFEIRERQKLMEVKSLSKTIATHILSSYKKSVRRILFIDYDGTLVPFVKIPAQAKIDKSTLEIIKKLASDEKNTLVIVSGRDKDFLEKQFKEVNVSLIAEHGYFLKRSGGEWEEKTGPDPNWKDSVKPILNEYVNRCNGTFIEEKKGSLAWHYRSADSDIAQMRLNEMKDDLTELIRLKTNFEIIEGKKVLEVKSGKYNKGEAALEIMVNEEFDFILAAGDDTTDEFLFKALPDWAVTVRVGNHPSFARYNIAENTLLLNFLKSMTDN